MTELPEYTVSALGQAIRSTLEGTFGRVRVKGELSSVKRYPSGHIYFSLKDENSVISSVIWRGVAAKISVALEEGLEAICTGRVSSYPARSNYQLIVDDVEIAGIGALLKMLEERKKKLAAEGLFDAQRKQPLPVLPQVVGVVTSPKGAVIRDIIARIDDRFPSRILLWPALVQGEEAAAQIVAGIKGLNALPIKGPIPRPDVIIVARGGGSVEDLMPFNEEAVVRAVAASRVPLVSAIGHETDTTLIDHVADLRAPTPTAAAELIVPVRSQLIDRLAENTGRLRGALMRGVEYRRTRLFGFARGLGRPDSLIESPIQRLDHLAVRLAGASSAGLDKYVMRIAGVAGHLRPPVHRLDENKRRLEAAGQALALRASGDLRFRSQMFKGLASRLEAISPAAVLARGFAIVRDRMGRPVTEAAGIRPGQSLKLQLHDGTVSVKADKNVDVPGQPLLI